MLKYWQNVVNPVIQDDRNCKSDSEYSAKIALYFAMLSQAGLIKLKQAHVLISMLDHPPTLE